MRLAALLLLTGCWRSTQAPAPATSNEYVEHVSPPEEAPPDEPTELSVEDGVEGGVVGGVPGGMVGGVVGGISTPPPPPPPPPPSPGHTVAPSRLNGNRLTGNTNFPLPAALKAAAAQAGKDKIVSTFKMCLDVTGTVTEVKPLKSTGDTQYDATIVGEIRQWTYTPWTENGQAVAVCTAFAFIWKI